MSTIKLTDDEVVAASLLLSAIWPIGIRTVDVTDAEGVGRAAFRGERSLLARDLATVTEGRVQLDDSVAAAFGAVASAARHTVVAIGRRTQPVAAAAPFVSFHSTADVDRWIIVASSPIGVADIEKVDRAGAVATLTQLQARCFEEGVPGGSPGDDLALFVGRFGLGQNDVLEFALGSVRLASVREPAMPTAPASWSEVPWEPDLAVAGLA
ncbi:hypothetical protein [Pengzhenrongella sp.]|uniref:hypothetical protein n=1 Tax=Pengzhenrongella sp. TaxID=2888820 RepID=UPI002F92265B